MMPPNPRSYTPLNLHSPPSQVEKVLQLHLACEQRIGIIIVGPAGSGKTTLWACLAAAYAKLGRAPQVRCEGGACGGLAMLRWKVVPIRGPSCCTAAPTPPANPADQPAISPSPPFQVHTLNPKALPRAQLLGSMNLDTREWSDGVLTAAARKVRARSQLRRLPNQRSSDRGWAANQVLWCRKCCTLLRQVVREPLEQRCWLVCDGDVDPEWIESLNSVLDDNRLLTLPNGERIQFASNVNFIFECHSLDYASPATVSRWAGRAAAAVASLRRRGCQVGGGWEAAGGCCHSSLLPLPAPSLQVRHAVPVGRGGGAGPGAAEVAGHVPGGQHRSVPGSQQFAALLQWLLPSGGAQRQYGPSFSSSSEAGEMKGWVQQYLPRALDLALARPRALPTTRQGLLAGVLAHLAPGCSSARHFATCLARGLLANTATEARAELLGELCRLTGETELLHVPPSADPLASGSCEHLQELDPEACRLVSLLALLRCCLFTLGELLLAQVQLKLSSRLLCIAAGADRRRAAGPGDAGALAAGAGAAAAGEPRRRS
jgi:hypothetical protein